MSYAMFRDTRKGQIAQVTKNPSGAGPKVGDWIIFTEEKAIRLSDGHEFFNNQLDEYMIFRRLDAGNSVTITAR